MKKIARTNYWNPKVKYVAKKAAQDFMKSPKVKTKSSGVGKSNCTCSCNCACSCTDGYD